MAGGLSTGLFPGAWGWLCPGFSWGSCCEPGAALRLPPPALLDGFDIRESTSFIEEHINRQVRPARGGWAELGDTGVTVRSPTGVPH